VSGLLLDTHAWIWLAAGNPRMAPHETRCNREAASGTLYLSSISIYEAATIGIETDEKKCRGKQAVVMRPTVREWIRDTLVGTRVEVIPADENIALAGALFHTMHGDPFDRLIVATALQHDVALLTADSKIIEFAARARARLLSI
jgi:PIN domain nuclease of toxin-antitoxin system